MTEDAKVLTEINELSDLLTVLRKGDRIEDALSARAIEQLFWEREFFRNHTEKIRSLCEKALFGYLLYSRKPERYEYPIDMEEFKLCIRWKDWVPVHWKGKIENVLRWYRNELIAKGRYRLGN